MRNVTFTPEAEIRVLVGRLNAGWVLCEQETDPRKKERLERHWIALLHQYEDFCDQVMSPRGIAA